MEEKEKKETEQELYDWQIEFKGYIEIKGKYEKMPTGYPMLRFLERAIHEAIATDPHKFRLYKYNAEVTDYDGEEEIDFESDME
jgi:hypothetical protein|tara:strand:+ start:41 stop:292 length:252 start_codon:yes stop_codon:yes gene_type:complete